MTYAECTTPLAGIVDTEEWRPVLGYEGLYEVSRSGLVRSLKDHTKKKPTKHPGGILEHSRINGSGYRITSLHANGKSRTFLTHKLVCEAFHGPRPGPDIQVDHINGEKLDNHADNLRWVTRKENIRLAHERGIFPQSKRGQRIHALVAARDATVLGVVRQWYAPQ